MTERVRGFPAFPAGVRKGRRFARTWWGNAWIKALEDTSLDHALLTKGRRYAHAGQVGSITVSPGRIAAPVHDMDDAPYRTQVFVEELTDAEWGRFLDQVAAKAGHIAALLDRDMPHDLVDAAEDAGVKLLPSIGDLEPECDCPDWGHPCKHAAALCYQASWLLDADPFVLLLLRGRSEQEVLDSLRGREAVAAGMPAELAYAQEVPALPAAVPVPAVGAAPSWPAAPGIAADALGWLVTNASTRARELLLGGDSEADLWVDSVRIAASHPELAPRLPRAGSLPRAARAWEYGGAAGLATLETAWTPSKAELARARAALADAWEGEEPPEFEVRRNHWTGDGVQLRYGRDGRWYPYREEDGSWWPAGPPAQDPASALGGLLGPS